MFLPKLISHDCISDRISVLKNRLSSILTFFLDQLKRGFSRLGGCTVDKNGKILIDDVGDLPVPYMGSSRYYKIFSSTDSGPDGCALLRGKQP